MIYVSRPKTVHTPVPHLDTYPRGASRYLNSVIFTEKEQALLSPAFTEFSVKNLQYDLVYIVKNSETNVDLQYSLRSISKFCSFKNLWIVGYKPRWVTNVKYLPTIQTGDKWKNSMINYEAACKSPEISENFILMNDDFFAIRQIVDWEVDLNKCLGTIDEQLMSFKNKAQLSHWQAGFVHAKQILKDLGCKTQINYETHMPIIINKTKFLEFLNLPRIIAFQKTNNVLHKRTIYKNLYPDSYINPTKIKDVKLETQKDLDTQSLNENWLSVFDYVVDNCRRYPRLNKLLRELFPEKCKFEI